MNPPVVLWWIHRWSRWGWSWSPMWELDDGLCVELLEGLGVEVGEAVEAVGLCC